VFLVRTRPHGNIRLAWIRCPEPGFTYAAERDALVRLEVTRLEPDPLRVAAPDAMTAVAPDPLPPTLPPVGSEVAVTTRVTELPFGWTDTIVV
jgi:hypothetical protein